MWSKNFGDIAQKRAWKMDLSGKRENIKTKGEEEEEE